MSTTVAPAAFELGWMTAWQEAVNSEPILPVIGKHFNANLLLGFGEKEYVVSVREGRIVNLTDQLRVSSVDTPWQFALRAPAETWAKYIQDPPPPMYNDIWAMAHPLHGNLKMDGDLLPLWQNLRSLNYMLEFMRRVRL
jgi:hypothetical protein